MPDDPSEDPTRRDRARGRLSGETADAGVASVPSTPGLSVFDPPEQRYAERGELGRGGMGRVVEAVDRALGRPVAIKQSLAIEPTDLARFEREARITARLQHPSVVPIHDVGRDAEGKPYYIMHKIDGEPLSDRVRDATTVRDRLALVSSLLGAIDAAAYAHAKRIVHRDIKPSNILLGRFGETLLIDWGIARELDDDSDETWLSAADTAPALTRFGVAYGTPGFMAPEQARGELVDARADVYALGATLYYLLAAKVPFGAVDDPTSAITRVGKGERLDLAAIPDDVPVELTAIATKATEPDPKDRYSDAGELAADLRRFLAGKLVAAHRYTTRERFVRWIRKHRIAVGVSALALVIVVVGGVLSIRQVIRDRDLARDASELAEERAEQQLLDRARVLADTDPTSAVAALRELRAESPEWPAARQIIRAAVRGGVERRIARHSDFIDAVAFSPDARRLASASKSIMIHDLQRGTERELASIDATALIWRDDRTLAFLSTTTKRAGVIDVESGTLRDFPVTAPSQITTAAGRVIVRDAIGSVTAFGGPHSEPSILVAKGSLAITARGNRIAILEPTRLQIISDRGAREIPIEPELGQGAIELSQNGKWIAVLGPRGLVREWDLDRPGEPQRWQLSARTTNELGYVEDTLYAWSGDSGFIAFERGTGVTYPRLATRDRTRGVLVDHLMPFEGGAILVTDLGQLAYATSSDAVPLPHRAFAIKSAAVATTGRWLALGGSEGDLLLVDLRSTLPQLRRISGGLRLDGVVPGRALLVGKAPTTIGMGDSTDDDPPGVTPFAGVGLLELDGGKLELLDARDLRTSSNASLILGQDWTRPDRFTVWNAAGSRIVELDHVAKLVFHEDAVLYVTDDLRIWRRRISAREPELLGALPSGTRVSPQASGTGPALVSLRIVGDSLMVALMDDLEHGRVLELGPTGMIERVPRMPGWPEVIGTTGSNVWWMSDRSKQSLWRVDTHSRRIVIPQGVFGLRVLDDHVWAIDDETLTEIDASGTIVRRIALPSARDRVRVYVTGGMLVLGSTGVVEIQPAANLQIYYRAPGRVATAMATEDGTLVVARTTLGDGSTALVWWTDPVPADPAAIRNYLSTLTNARLAAESSALTWE